MDTRREALCLEKLKELCVEEFISWDYSIGKRRESALCIFKDNDLWDVVFVERGNDFSLKQYDNVIEACLDFLDRMADTGDEGRLKNRFLELLIVP